MRKKSVTISDIAEKTGYSKTTVSFAFNWPNRISAEAVEKIMKCANDLGYQGGNDILQDSANRYKTVCVLVPEMGQPNGSIPIWARPMFELYQQCAIHGFMFSMIDQKRSSDVYFAKYSAVDAFLILCNNIDTSFLEIVKKRRIPVIGINLDVAGDTEEEKVHARVNNSLRCIEMAFNLIRNGEDQSEVLEGAYTFFYKNN